MESIGHTISTSFKKPVLILYMVLNAFNASSGVSFMASKNFGVSGKNENRMEFVAFIIEIAIINRRHGTKFTT